MTETNETTALPERWRTCAAIRAREMTVKQACALHGVSRATMYRWREIDGRGQRQSPKDEALEQAQVALYQAQQQVEVLQSENTQLRRALTMARDRLRDMTPDGREVS